MGFMRDFNDCPRRRLEKAFNDGPLGAGAARLLGSGGVPGGSVPRGGVGGP